MGKAIAFVPPLALVGLLAIAGPAVSQEVRLTGVLVSGPASLAIIAGADGRERVYRLGHEVHPGATLAEVSRNSAIVVRDGRREWLPLVRGQRTESAALGAAQQTPPRAAEPAPAVPVAQPGGDVPLDLQRTKAGKQSLAEPARDLSASH